LGGLPELDNFVVFSRAFIGLLFVVAGVAKLAGRAELARVVRAYEILPAGWSAGVARLLPPLEVAVGAVFAVGLGAPVAGTAISLLLVSFSFAVGVNLRRGRRAISCGCFGSRAHGISWTIVVRNTALAAAALVAGWRDAPDATIPLLPSLLAAGAALAIYAAARAAFDVSRLDDVTRSVSAGVGAVPSREGT
jgi:hypothetical protein